MRVNLLHWDRGEGVERAERLRRQGIEVHLVQTTGPAALRELRAASADATVIDLSRLPSHGREVAISLRHRASTRHIPLVFVEGRAEKVEAIRALLPDATFTTWAAIGRAVTKAVAGPPASPVVPGSVFDAYSGTPLPKKLGIAPGATFALMGAPEGFAQTLGVLPEGARLVAEARGRRDLTVWFVRSRRDLERRLPAIVRSAAYGPLWIVWPKKASAMRSDLGEPDVRAAGLGAGLVDYKICSVDITWSGLKFTRRSATKAGRKPRTGR